MTIVDEFRGDDAELCSSAKALLSLDSKGVITPAVGSHARDIISAFVVRMEQKSEPVSVPAALRQIASWMDDGGPTYHEAEMIGMAISGPVECSSHKQCTKAAKKAFSEAARIWERMHPESPAKQHTDDAAVDRFSAEMKEKLAKKRAEGRGGWQGATSEYLSQLLREHVGKGDPVDVANLAMMLHQNGQGIERQPAPDLEDLLSSKKDFYDDAIEDIAFALAFECEEAELDPGDKVTINREKLKAIAARVLEKAEAKIAQQQPAPDVELKPDDLIVQHWSNEPRAQWDNSQARGIKVTHVPSGITVTCETESSVHANKEKALGILAERLAGWREPDVAGLVEALQPFADFIAGTDPVWSDERRISTLDYDFTKLRLGLFRKAQAALAAHRKQGGDE